ncbi:MAG: hypothetical protein R3279_01210 [Putridiphycobacter sp.]|nr:hypothetical protein [Putridiphycobacter sp.]
MKNITLAFLLIFFCENINFGQSSFKKVYIVTDSISYFYKTVKRKDEEKVKWKVAAYKMKRSWLTRDNSKYVYESKSTIYLNKKQKSPITLNATDSIAVKTVELVGDKKDTTIKKIVNYEYAVLNDWVRDTIRNFFTTKTQKSNATKMKAGLKFEKNSIVINPWYFNDSKREWEYRYQLKNRQEIRLRYQQNTIVPVTIPLRIQFGKDNATKFTTGVSIGALFGRSIGYTRFSYRKNIENFQRSHEFTVGAVLNFSETEFTTSDSLDRKTVSTAFGLGALYSYEKINFGIVGGLEYAHGYGAEQWNFQGQPWVGIIIGYSLFE